MNTEIEIQSWAEFPSALLKIESLKEEMKRKHSGRPFQEPLFRGLGNSEWQLQTTLERSPDADNNETLISYYRKVTASKPLVESLSGRTWDEIPDFPAFASLLEKEQHNWIDRTLSRNTGIYSYLVYLRHHGFPSPLLDWTASPYVAAMFAFDSMDATADQIAIHAYVRDSMQASGDDAHLFVIGPYIKTHPRHYLQQSRYSLCLQLRTQQIAGTTGIDYGFLPHEDGLYANRNDDLSVRILIPASERRVALQQLDNMTLTPYSVYGSEESLIRTVARREFLFGKH